MLSKTAIYNLKVVLKETGLKPDVLRAWERRYGLPTPERTEGGHRLYSEYDIGLLRWLVHRQNEGLSISSAVKMLQDEIANGNDPISKLSSSLQPQPSDYFDHADDTSLAALRASWLNAALNYNEVKAEQELGQAFALYPVDIVCIEVLQRGIGEVGMLWHEGKVTVQQEHYISAMAHRRLDSLLLAAPAPSREQTILVGCPANEWHSLTPLLISVLLRRKGYNVIYLGPNVPAARFEVTLQQVKPDLVILSAQQLTTASELHKLSTRLLEFGVAVAFGGRIFNMHPRLRKSIAGSFLGETVDQAIEQADHLLRAAPLTTPNFSLPSNESLEALDIFRNIRHKVDSKIAESVQNNPWIDLEKIEIANMFMGNTIISCLELGDMAYLDTEIEWLNIFVKSQQLPPSMIPYYLKLYADAIQRLWPTNTSVIHIWFTNQENKVLNEK